MAFSHRPTWHAARARGSTFDLRNYSTGGVASKQIQELDLANHMKMKYREIGQGRSDEIAQRDLVKELQDKEKKHYEDAGKYPKNYGRIKDDVSGAEAQKTETAAAEASKEKEKEFDDSDDEVSSSGESSSEDDDEEQEELMRELEKIKREREEAKQREEKEAVEIEAKILQQEQQQKKAALNPGAFTGAKVKRRWDEDVVFRFQSRTEPEMKKRFINDTIRNDFHKKFLHRYIK